MSYIEENMPQKKCQAASFSYKDINIKSIVDIFETVDKYKHHMGRKRKRQEFESDVNYMDMSFLVDIVEPLKKLDNLIGMEEVKKNIIDQILFFTQGLNSAENMHTVLTGPPGVGKTTLGKILAEIYCNLGFLDEAKFKVVSRSDFIAGYVGQTALKTQRLLEKSVGGVLFVDEAYSLGDSRDDGYSKECIDTINKFLSENTRKFVMIIAGYKDQLDKYFFSYNKGLERRFPWRYNIELYDSKELKNIFEYQVQDDRWHFEKGNKTLCHLQKVFENNKNYFKNSGGDTLLLFDKCKICHSRRVFGLKGKVKRYLSINDIDEGMKNFKIQKDKHKDDTGPPIGMYL